MENTKNEIVQTKRLTSGEGNCFFGYYDIPAWSKNEKYHLYHRVDFWERLPVETDVAQLGVIDLSNGKFNALAQTTAWNFQQGSMLQWHPKYPNSKIIFNIRENGTYRSVIMDINTGKKRTLEYPIANVDPLGRYALSINFNRMFDFRPGYGYAGISDPYRNENHSKDDGIFLIDLETGKGKLILSLDELWELSKDMFDQDQKLLINHINFNTDGSRFVFLLRNFPKSNERWGTATVTANIEGEDIYFLTDYTISSHYNWKNKEELLIYSQGKEGLQLNLLTDKTELLQVIDKEFFTADGHCSYSPDQRWILYDSYWDKDGFRNLYLYDLHKKKGHTLATYYAYPNIDGDIRCDLHPRWSPSERYISFDSVHEGKRQIYYIDLKESRLF